MCRVLILDDDKFFAETIQMILDDSDEAKSDVTTTFEDALERVKTANRYNKPYEVFLIDQRLGAGKDGIEVMKELRTISPDSDTIIFTGAEDSGDGVRAYEAGAFRYLPKPFENKELLYLLKAVKLWRKEIREHTWQKIFSRMMEEALQKSTFHDVAEIVVKYSLELGFKRAHLFWIPTREDAHKKHQMVGITCAGKDCLPGFGKNEAINQLYPLRHWFRLDQLYYQSHNALSLTAAEVTDAAKRVDDPDFLLPTGDMAFLPLWSTKNLLGTLMLDHGLNSIPIRDHEHSLLSLFAQQASLALENASLYEREKRSRLETDTINKISQQITARAAVDDLTNLLEEVRKHIGSLMDISNFAVVLHDEETNELDFHLLYVGNVCIANIRKPTQMGLEGYLISIGESLFLSENIDDFIRNNDIKIDGDIPSCWMGVPLKVSDRVIGGLILQQFHTDKKYINRDWILFQSIANQVAGAIKLSRDAETEKEDAERLNILRRASTDLLQVAQKNKDDLWTMVLTLATASFGMSFNRALLFLLDEDRKKLIAKAGIGTEDLHSAKRDWELDKKRHYQYDDFLKELSSDRLRHTDFQNLSNQIEWEYSSSKKDAIHEALRQRKYVVVPEEEIDIRIPIQIRQKVALSSCAILPLQVGNRSLGVVVVDNKHNKLPIQEKSLERLQTILNNAGLVWETFKSEALLDANLEIMGSANQQPLKQTLKRICETAQTITEADWVLVYPIKEGEELEFDQTNAAYAGGLKHEFVLKGKPNSNGISVHILEAGQLVVNNTRSKDAKIGKVHISAHDFIKREGVKALIGIAIRDTQRDENLGIFYLDYRTPQKFSPSDEHHAKALASLAAVAISNARRFDEQRQRNRLEAAQTTAEAIGTELDLPQMFRKVLHRLHKYFKQTTLCILTYDEDENALKFAPSTLEFYKIYNPKFQGQHTYPLRGKSLACRSARLALKRKKAEPLNIPDVRNVKDYLPLNPHTRSELCVPLLSSEKELLGVLVLERSRLHGFDDDDVALVGTVASQLSMAVERAQHSEQLAFNSTVAANYAWAAEIAHDINREIGHIRNWAFLIKDTSEDGSLYSLYADKIEESAAILSAGPWIIPPKQSLPFDQFIEKSLEKIQIRKDITLDLDLKCDGAYVYGDSLTFHRILKHLVRNASDGTSKITGKKNIFIRTRRLGNNVVEFQIEDNGLGVSEEARPYIFQRQFTTKGSGGGVGLLIVRQMVEDMDGKIRLLPQEPGKGAVFSIKLPSQDQAVNVGAGMEVE